MNQIRSIIEQPTDPTASIRTISAPIIPSATIHHGSQPSYRAFSFIANQISYPQPKVIVHHPDKLVPSLNLNGRTDGSINRSLYQYRFIHLLDLQSQGILPKELTIDQQMRLQKLDVQVAGLSVDKQRQFIETQRTIVPKYLATTVSQPVAQRRSRSELIDDQVRREQSIILRPNTKRRFTTRKDAIERLLPYHLFRKPPSTNYEPTLLECEKFDELFEKKARRLLRSTERLQESIERIAVANEPQMIDRAVYDQYVLAKIELEDLREDVETRKRHKSNSFDSSSDSSNNRLEPVMSDEAYFSLFQSDG